MNFRTHLNIQFFCQRKRTFDDLSPVFNRFQKIVDHRHFRSHYFKSQSVRQTDISFEHFYGFLCRQISVSQYMRIDPVSILYRNDFIFITKTPPFFHPLICRIRIVLNMCICKNFNSMSSHIMKIFKTVLQCLCQSKFG